MKKTEYFLSNMTEYSRTKSALEEVVRKRDDFIVRNTEIIGEIEEENVSMFRVTTGFIHALLKLTYYPK